MRPGWPSRRDPIANCRKIAGTHAVTTPALISRHNRPSAWQRSGRDQSFSNGITNQIGRR